MRDENEIEIEIEIDEDLGNERERDFGVVYGSEGLEGGMIWRS